jgi:glyoxylase-like metal-dependent hydrolase (beta-lactamase superfamily II)
MLNNVFSFTIGKIDCKIVMDVSGEITGSFLDSMCLFVKMPHNEVLIDTGWGTGSSPYSGKVLENLETSGISASRIDTVIFTHAHPDHIGGNTDTDGKPSLPNARFIMNKREWEYWLSKPNFSPHREERKLVAFASIKKNLEAIQDRFELIEINEEKEFIPGITLIDAPGHSPGLMALKFSSEAQQLLCISDVFHQPSELSRLDWSIISGELTGQAIQTRLKILSMAAPGVMVFACHFPFPGLGHIIKKENGWLWQPITL